VSLSFIVCREYNTNVAFTINHSLQKLHKMHYRIKNPKYLLALIFSHITVAAFCQYSSGSKNDLSDASMFLQKKDSINKNHFGIEITASMLPGAKIMREEGKYKLKSHIQSSYDLGINYLNSINKSLSISTGLHFIVGKRNFFAHIPSEDINNRNGRYYIEEKELWGSFRIPLLIEKKLNYNRKNDLSIKTGFNFRYSGLMPDESFGVTVIDSNNQFTDVFNAQFSARNDGKPWVTFLAGASKSFRLDNQNILSVSLQADLSTTFFFKGKYEFTIPNQPIATGTYKINGTSFGLSLQYIFTGSNKQLVKPRKVIKLVDTLMNKKRNIQFEREVYLNKYVFKGNHIQFNCAIISTFKSRLENLTGNHPVTSNATPGLLLGLKYQVNFNNKYSLITGTEIILSGRNFATSFSKNDFSPPLVSDYNTKQSSLIQDLVLSLPVVIEKRWLYSTTKYLLANFGFRLNFSTGADLDVFSLNLLNTSNSFYNAGEVNVYANNDAKPWVSIPLNVGHAWLLKNNNVMQLSICSNISFTKYVNGTYQVDVPHKPLTTGRYSSTGSYIGLSMNYVFTNANYRIRKEYEKKL
jgi:hypothetical protein